MPNAKIYSTTQSFPPGDIRALIGAPQHFGIGQYVSYVLAGNKAEAAQAIHGALSGGSVSTNDLRVVANRLDQISQEHVQALYDSGLLRKVGDVVVADRDLHRTVVLVRAGEDEDGDPQAVGNWSNYKNDEDITVTCYITAEGDRFDLPVDEAFRRVILEQRAEKAAEAKVIADAAVAIERVGTFLAAHADRPLGDSDREDIYQFDHYRLTVTDLRALLAAAATVLK